MPQWAYNIVKLVFFFLVFVAELVVCGFGWKLLHTSTLHLMACQYSEDVFLSQVECTSLIIPFYPSTINPINGITSLNIVRVVHSFIYFLSNQNRNSKNYRERRTCDLIFSLQCHWNGIFHLKNFTIDLIASSNSLYNFISFACSWMNIAMTWNYYTQIIPTPRKCCQFHHSNINCTHWFTNIFVFCLFILSILNLSVHLHLLATIVKYNICLNFERFIYVVAWQCNKRNFIWFHRMSGIFIGEFHCSKIEV